MEYETPKRKFHDTASRCHQKSICATPWFSTDMPEGGGVRGECTQLRHLNASAPPELAQRVSSSLRDSARAILPRAASRETHPGPRCPHPPHTHHHSPLGSDDLWPAQDTNAPRCFAFGSVTVFAPIQPSCADSYCVRHSLCILPVLGLDLREVRWLLWWFMSSTSTYSSSGNSCSSESV